MADHRWPEDWDARRTGEACPMCATDGGDETPHGVRIAAGVWSDAYLGRFPVRPGYTFVVWKGRHVTEPTELAAEESAGFWSEVAAVARAAERLYEPWKMNWLSLGNGVPHLHVHLVPRFADDPMAGGPIESDAFERSRDAPLSQEDLATQAAALRELLRSD